MTEACTQRPWRARRERTVRAVIARERLRASRRAATPMLRRDHGVASSIQNSQARRPPFLLLGSCATPPAPGSCLGRQPGGWGMKSLTGSTAPFRPEPDARTSWSQLPNSCRTAPRFHARIDENLQVVQLQESCSASKKRLSTSLSGHKWLSTAHIHATSLFYQIRRLDGNYSREST